MSNQTENFFNSSTTRTTTTTASGPSVDASTTPDILVQFFNQDLHDFVMECKINGLPTNAMTKRLYENWRRLGLEQDVILEYIIPETMLAPQPSLRYADAIARRLIKSSFFTLSLAIRNDKKAFKDLPM